MEPPSPPQPVVLARFCQDWLLQVGREDEPYRSRFLSHVPADMREQINGAARVAWLPLSIHIKLADVLLETFGLARAHDYYRRALVSALEGPILSPLFRTGVRLLGLSPGSFVRWSGRGYDASYRNAGKLVGEVLSPYHARATFSELPAICTASDAWLTSSQGSAYGMYDALRIEGVVRLDTTGRARGTMVLELEWGDKKKAQKK